MKIRQANYSDLKWLADIEKEAAKIFVEYLGPDTKQGQGTLDPKIIRKSFDQKLLFVVEKDLCVAGFLAALLYADFIHIEEVSVRYKSQGKGYGKALVETILNEAQKRSIFSVTLTTDKQLPWNGPFYKRLGFKQLSDNELPDSLKAKLCHERHLSPEPTRRVGMIFNIDK